jgi:predicted  nucleic acid-binding Zn-ribbon protein
LVREAEVDSEIEVLNSARAEATTAVPEDLTATYAQLRLRLGGVGAARLVGARCGGCYLTLPATELDRLRHQPPGTLSFCDQCGRILVPTTR